MTDEAAEVTAQDDVKARRGFGWVAIPLVIFAGMAVMFGYALKSGDPSRLPSALIGKTVPAYDFPALDGLVADGKPVPGVMAKDLAAGTLTVVNFFASWCAPCRQEHPLLEALKARTRVRMVGVNYKDPAPGGLRFLTQLGNPYDRVGVDRSGRGGIEWGVYGMPETFLVDGEGRVVYKHVGPITAESLERAVLPAIAKAGGSRADRAAK